MNDSDSISCAKCGKLQRIKPEWIGRKARCKGCGFEVVIQLPSEVATRDNLPACDTKALTPSDSPLESEFFSFKNSINVFDGIDIQKATSRKSAPISRPKRNVIVGVAALVLLLVGSIGATVGYNWYIEQREKETLRTQIGSILPEFERIIQSSESLIENSETLDAMYPEGVKARETLREIVAELKSDSAKLKRLSKGDLNLSDRREAVVMLHFLPAKSVLAVASARVIGLNLSRRAKAQQDIINKIRRSL